VLEKAKYGRRGERKTSSPLGGRKTPDRGGPDRRTRRRRLNQTIRVRVPLGGVGRYLNSAGC